MIRLVYTAGLFQGETPWEIARSARRGMYWGAEITRRGAVPVVPCVVSSSSGTLGAYLVDGAVALLRRCDAVVLLPNWRGSPFATTEQDEALALGLTIFESKHHDGDFYPPRSSSDRFYLDFERWVSACEEQDAADAMNSASGADSKPCGCPRFVEEMSAVPYICPHDFGAPCDI
mgnify:CR=1 FL=1